MYYNVLYCTFESMWWNELPLMLFFLAVISALPSLSTLWTMLKHRDLGDEIGVSPSHPICIGVSGVSHVRKLDLQAETWPSHLAHDKTEDCRGRAVGHAEHCFLELAWICLDFHAWTQPLEDAALLLKFKMHETDSTTSDAKPQRSNVPSSRSDKTDLPMSVQSTLLRSHIKLRSSIESGQPASHKHAKDSFR
jgi:hypothetical protein